MKVLDDLRLPGQKFVLPGGKHKPIDAEEELELVRLAFINLLSLQIYMRNKIKNFCICFFTKKIIVSLFVS